MESSGGLEQNSVPALNLNRVVRIIHDYDASVLREVLEHETPPREDTEARLNEIELFAKAAGKREAVRHILKFIVNTTHTVKNDANEQLTLFD